MRLIENPAERRIQGGTVRDSIEGHHTGFGWKQHVNSAFSALPAEHSTYFPITAARTPDAINEYWTVFSARISSNFEETLEHALTRALLMGLKPRLNKAMRLSCKQHESLRARKTIPFPLLVLLCNCLFPVLPATLNSHLFRFVSFISRASVLRRLRKRTMRLLGKGEPSTGYDTYRYVRSSLRES